MCVFGKFSLSALILGRETRFQTGRRKNKFHFKKPKWNPVDFHKILFTTRNFFIKIHQDQADENFVYGQTYQWVNRNFAFFSNKQ